jgi:uncharacterized paraquat-inducible protein A
MPRIIAKVLLAILMIPLAGLTYLIAKLIGEQFIRWRGVGNADYQIAIYVFCGTVTWLWVALYWVLLWRELVPLNPRRIVKSLEVAIFALVIAAVIGLALGALLQPPIGAFIASVLTPLFWLIATVFVWRESDAERGYRLNVPSNSILCPKCKYNLTGLTELRCPECGTRFTLDGLLAAQPNRLVDELEE